MGSNSPFFICVAQLKFCASKTIILLRLLLIICCTRDIIHTVHITIIKNTPSITMLDITKCLSLASKLRLSSHEDTPHQSPSSCCSGGLVSCLRLLILLWMDFGWSLKFMQHMPSKSSHPWPKASSKNSMAALFCSVACCTNLTSISIAERAALVALASSASHSWAYLKKTKCEQYQLLVSSCQRWTLQCSRKSLSDRTSLWEPTCCTWPSAELQLLEMSDLDETRSVGQ